MEQKKPTLLMILDGYGLAPAGPGNAISLADKPHIDSLFSKYPHARLLCSGQAVGLPDGQMGNSEVGHMNIGGGRVVFQDLSRIDNAIKSGEFFDNRALNDAIDHVRKNSSTLHLLGLVSDGGVHSHIDHLFELIRMAEEKNVGRVLIHAFLDGRDVPPKSADGYLARLENRIKGDDNISVATISGRYYAMDRDKRWDRIQACYDAMTGRPERVSHSSAEAIKEAYGRGETDEFVKPVHIENTGYVEDGDAMIMFNFRPDRARQITRSFTDPAFDGFPRDKVIDDLCYITMTEYDASMPRVEVAYPPETYPDTLGEYASKLGLKQLRIAETEKYAHVTFFFNGGVEEPYPGEDRILIPSPKVATYDLKPEMSAPEVTDRLLRELDRRYYDLIILNFANADMVGHTGVIPAVVKAIETLDTCVDKIIARLADLGGQALITADHGNADVMLDEDGKPMTAHSLNPVPVVCISDKVKSIHDGRLCDLAPTLLEMMGIKKPAAMTGESLIDK